MFCVMSFLSILWFAEFRSVNTLSRTRTFMDLNVTPMIWLGLPIKRF